MSVSYKKLQQKKFPRKNPQITGETRFWSSYEKSTTHTCQAKVSTVEFSKVSPNDVAITSSSRVEIFDGSTGIKKKNVSRFKGVAYGGSFRADGKLMVAGGEEGIVRVFDLSSRDVLRSFKKIHKNPIHVTKFSSDNTHVLSGSDDKTMRRLDIPTETAINIFEGHTDYIRAGLELPSAPDTWVSGSYDHMVKTWDVRSGQSMLSLDHGEPVECLQAFPHGGLLLSGGGNVIKVWDLIAGKLMQTLSNHQKTVTCLALNGDGTRILSGGLDHHVKVYDVTTFDVTHSWKFKAPVMGIGLGAKGEMLAVGLLDGSAILHKRVKPAEPSAVVGKFGSSAKADGQGRAATRFYMRGHDYTPAPEDFAVQNTGRKQQLKVYDRYLKKFQYHQALDAALDTQRAPIIVTVLEELVRRGGLRLALNDRDQHGLEVILSFAVKQIDNPQHAVLIVDLANVLLDMYTSVLGQSVAVDELVLKLKQKIEAELAFQTTALELNGTLEMVLASSTAVTTVFDDISPSALTTNTNSTSVNTIATTTNTATMAPAANGSTILSTINASAAASGSGDGKTKTRKASSTGRTKKKKAKTS